MDGFESTFFNLGTASTQHSLCSTSTNNNSNGSSSSLPYLEKDNANTLDNLLQTQADDLDAMLLPSSTNADHKVENNAEDELATLLDSLPDDPISNTAVDGEPTSLDSIIGQCLTTGSTVITRPNQPTILEPLKPKTSIVVKSEHVSTSNVVQLKMIKPLGHSCSNLKPIALSGSNLVNATKVIPITVHSLTGQKHSIVRTVMPIGMPCVRVLPAGSRPLLNATVVKQEPPAEKPQPKLSLTDPSHLQIIVCNVVASFRVRCHLNLRQIALQSFDVVYRRESQKVVMRMRKPKCTAYMWSTGKVVCTGSTSEENARKAARKFCRRLLRIGYKIRFADFKVVNVLAVSKMPYAINIREFSYEHQGKHCSYEPELHPGVTYREPTSKATLKIFSTGSVTVTGRSVSRAKEGVHNVFPMLREFYKFDKPNTNLDYEDALPSDTEDFT